MKCPKCGEELKKEISDIEIFDSRVGLLLIRHAEYWECSGCATRLYTPKTVTRIDEKRDNKTKELIKKKPIGEFITLVEAARLLGISKQAVHKNRKIYGLKLGRKPVYLRKSVIMYKATHDGRFPLYTSDAREWVTGVSCSIPYSEEGVLAGRPSDQYAHLPGVGSSASEVAYAH